MLLLFYCCYSPTAATLTTAALSAPFPSAYTLTAATLNGANPNAVNSTAATPTPANASAVLMLSTWMAS